MYSEKINIYTSNVVLYVIYLNIFDQYSNKITTFSQIILNVLVDRLFLVWMFKSFQRLIVEGINDFM